MYTQPPHTSPACAVSLQIDKCVQIPQFTILTNTHNHLKQRQWLESKQCRLWPVQHDTGFLRKNVLPKFVSAEDSIANLTEFAWNIVFKIKRGRWTSLDAPSATSKKKELNTWDCNASLCLSFDDLHLHFLALPLLTLN